MKYPNFAVAGLLLTLAVGIPNALAPQAIAAEAATAAVVPATLDALWKSIDAKSAELKITINRGALDQVHHQAYAIRDLVAALPGMSKSLAPERLAKVQAGVKFVATLAERLDATGDAKDAAGTKQNFEKLSNVLASLRSNYFSPK